MSLDGAGCFDWAEFLTEYVAASPVICFLAAGTEGKIRTCNTRMADLLKVPAAQLHGESLWTFLTDPDADRLRARIASGPDAPHDGMLLNFVSAGNVPTSLECMVRVRPGEFAVVGNDYLKDERALQQELQGINAELLVLVREHARQGKEVQSAKLALEKTLTELNTLYWQMRKVGEVLPICMKCGKVESGEARWEDLIAFMNQNFPFLSHGYCPECAAGFLSWQAEGPTA